MARKNLLEHPYPINLICDVWAIAPFEFEPPPDMELGVQHALTTLRNPEEQAVLLMRYREGLTSRAAGERLGITPSRVHQVENHALRRLRHPMRSTYIRYGYRHGFFRQLKMELPAGYDQDEIGRILEQSAAVSYICAIPDAFTRIDAILVRSFFHPVDKLGLDMSACGWMPRNHIGYIWQLCLLRREDLLHYSHDVRLLDNISLALSAYRLTLDNGLLAGKPELFDYALHRHTQLAGTPGYGVESFVTGLVRMA